MGQRHKHADVIIAWAEGKELQVRAPLAGNWSDLSIAAPHFYEDWEYRIKPPAKKYRVVLFRKYNDEPFAAVANSQGLADSFEDQPSFVRWLTDWIEYEE